MPVKGSTFAGRFIEAFTRGGASSIVRRYGPPEASPASLKGTCDKCLYSFAHTLVRTHTAYHTIVERGTYTHSAGKRVFFWPRVVCDQLDHVPLPTIENVNNLRPYAIKTRTWLDYFPERAELTGMRLETRENLISRHFEANEISQSINLNVSILEKN